MSMVKCEFVHIGSLKNAIDDNYGVSVVVFDPERKDIFQHDIVNNWWFSLTTHRRYRKTAVGVYMLPGTPWPPDDMLKVLIARGPQEVGQLAIAMAEELIEHRDAARMWSRPGESMKKAVS